VQEGGQAAASLLAGHSCSFEIAGTVAALEGAVVGEVEGEAVANSDHVVAGESVSLVHSVLAVAEEVRGLGAKALEKLRHVQHPAQSVAIQLGVGVLEGELAVRVRSAVVVALTVPAAL
jgi:hypothetical protein